MPKVLSLLQATKMANCLFRAFSKKDFVRVNASICFCAAENVLSCYAPSTTSTKKPLWELSFLTGWLSHMLWCLIQAAVWSTDLVRRLKDLIVCLPLPWRAHGFNVMTRGQSAECQHTQFEWDCPLKEKKNMTTIFLLRLPSTFGHINLSTTINHKSVQHIFLYGFKRLPDNRAVRSEKDGGKNKLCVTLITVDKHM